MGEGGWEGGILVLDERPAAPGYGLAFPEEEDVSVSAHGRGAAPLVAREGDEPPGTVELLGHPGEPGPEAVRNLEVVTLVGDDVQHRLVPGEGEVVLHRVGPDGLFALGVKIGPPAAQAHLRLDYDGVGLAGEARLRALEGEHIGPRAVEAFVFHPAGPAHGVAPSVLVSESHREGPTVVKEPATTGLLGRMLALPRSSFSIPVVLL